MSSVKSKLNLMATDIEAWFAALDRFADVPFIEAEHVWACATPGCRNPCAYRRGARARGY
jgi:hypothetical protein